MTRWTSVRSSCPVLATPVTERTGRSNLGEVVASENSTAGSRQIFRISRTKSRTFQTDEHWPDRNRAAAEARLVPERICAIGLLLHLHPSCSATLSRARWRSPRLAWFHDRNSLLHGTLHVRARWHNAGDDKVNPLPLSRGHREIGGPVKPVGTPVGNSHVRSIALRGSGPARRVTAG